jgi:hypothetical protein
MDVKLGMSIGYLLSVFEFRGGRVVVRGQVIMGFGLGGVERWASASSSAVGLSRRRSPVGLRLGAIFGSSDRLWAA